MPLAASRVFGPSAAYTLPSASTATPSPATPFSGRDSWAWGGMKAVTRSSPAGPIRTPLSQPGWRVSCDSESMAYSISSSVMNRPLMRPNWW